MTLSSLWMISWDNYYILWEMTSTVTQIRDEKYEMEGSPFAIKLWTEKRVGI